MARVELLCVSLVLLVQGAVCQTTPDSATELVNVTQTESEFPSTSETPSTTVDDTVGPAGPPYVIVEEPTLQPDPDFGIRYYLYTRDHPTSFVVLGNASLIRNTSFDVRLPTIFLIHGFTGSGDTTSVVLIKDALLYTEEVNVVSVHWEQLARGPEYEPAANNTAIVGAHLARTIERLLTEEGVLLESIHVIGFSLGAQVAGMAGSLLSIGRLPRITALDPAGPSFHRRQREWRLDDSDAEFVLVLHTSGGLVSFQEPLGHVDFFPNGGFSPQPACEQQTVQLVCSHLIAPLYFTESVYKPEAFAGVRCASWTDFTEGLCENGEPVYLGLHTPSSARGSFFLRTSSQEPYGLGPGSTIIADNKLDIADRREGRTVELQDGRNDADIRPEAQAKGSTLPEPVVTLVVTVCTALLTSILCAL